MSAVISLFVFCIALALTRHKFRPANDLGRKNKFSLRIIIADYVRYAPIVTPAMLLLKAAAAMLSFIMGAQFVDRALAVKAMGLRPAVFSAAMLVVIRFFQTLGNNLYSFFSCHAKGACISGYREKHDRENRMPAVFLCGE